MNRWWIYLHIALGIAAGQVLGHLVGMGPILRAVCGIAAAMVWTDRAQAIAVWRRSRRSERYDEPNGGPGR